MEKVEIVHPMIGICHMSVCCVKNATNEEILEVCNCENMSGTSSGWTTVYREDLPPKTDPDEFQWFNGKTAPVPCDEYKDRIHVLVGC